MFYALNFSFCNFNGFLALTAVMATAPEISLRMRSTDLIKKAPLDYGGFGEVYLCYHATLGQVVLKTVYTGPLRNE